MNSSGVTRRTLLGGLAVAAVAEARAESPERPKALRIGYQKLGVLLVAKARRILESRFEPQGISVKWLEFAFGPPWLEALGAGAVDYGYTGDSPPIFAQAARANFVYAAAIPAKAYAQGVVAPANAPIFDVAGVAGKRIGVAKASSGHSLLIAALEAAGLAWSDISPVYLAPADAAAAFTSGAIDAWAIWDPFLAIAEARAGARQIQLDPVASTQSSFFLANRTYAGKYPWVIHAVNEDLQSASEWATRHRDDVAALYTEATGVPLDAQRTSVARAEFAVAPLDESLIARQQAVADRYLRLGLIPASIDVREYILGARTKS